MNNKDLQHWFVKSSENSSFGISRITQPIELKCGVQLKETRPFLLISLSLKMIHKLGFYDDSNFLKNVCNRSSCRKF